ncbi:MAG: ABC transporter permease [archaeon]
MIKDYFTLALKNTRRRRLRSWLTIVGILMSVAIIFVLVSLSVGLENAVKEQFRQLGSDKFFIMAAGQFGPPGSGGAAELTIRDVDSVERVSGVKAVSYVTIGNGKIEFGDEQRFRMILGIPMDKVSVYESIYEAMSIKAEEGRLIRGGDKNNIMIGYDYKYGDFFSKPVGAGDKLVIQNKEFKVVGILESMGNSEDDRNIYIPLEGFKEIFPEAGDRVDEIIVQIQPGEDVKDISEKVEKKLIKDRGLTEKTKDFSVLTPEEILRSFGDILNIITGFLVGIATISLVVGAIGIMNTMYTSVIERTKEIGTMKAVGARNSDILKIFVIESGYLGLIGGIIGVILGIVIGQIIEYIAINQLGTNLLQVSYPLWLVLGSLAFAFVIGSASGFLPALQASKLRPVDALRYE